MEYLDTSKEKGLEWFIILFVKPELHWFFNWAKENQSNNTETYNVIFSQVVHMRGQKTFCSFKVIFANLNKHHTLAS